jgi:hypothetical protein
VRLIGANLSNANLRYANLSGANLSRATFIHADLSDVDLSGATLINTDLRGAVLFAATLSNANISNANISNANFTAVRLERTIFAGIDLQLVKGLETVRHVGPSTVGIDTLERSQGKIPEVFLQEAGVSDSSIAYARSLITMPLEYYTCFISYSSKDELFAQRLYIDLQSKGVRCWYAPEDMKTGDIIRDRIDLSIRTHDKLLLVLSEHSVQSKWVRSEVEAALAKEGEGKPPVLFPIRLDDTVINSTVSWATYIQNTRHIANFSRWEYQDDYQKAFNRLLRDLQQREVSKND